MDKIDMHIHSCYSDGYSNPREIVKKAKLLGIKAICLTDHDVFQGLSEFMEAALEFKIDALPGIEITSKYKGVDVHILGYGIDYTREFLLKERLQKHWEAGNIRAKKILQKYADINLMKATFEDIRRETNCQGPVISSMHIREYRSKISNISFEQTKGEIWRGGIAWADFDESLLMTPMEAVAFIQEIGGVAILAHPGEFCHRSDSKNPKDGLLILFEILEILETIGLMGIEVYCPKHTPEQSYLFARLAKGRNLLMTAGSDYHGDFKPHASLGIKGITYKDFKRFKKICSYK